jgi:hypothetical protein
MQLSNISLRILEETGWKDSKTFRKNTAQNQVVTCPLKETSLELFQTGKFYPEKLEKGLKRKIKTNSKNLNSNMFIPKLKRSIRNSIINQRKTQQKLKYKTSEPLNLKTTKATPNQTIFTTHTQ